jgi:hypothetical protein
MTEMVSSVIGSEPVEFSWVDLSDADPAAALAPPTRRVAVPEIIKGAAEIPRVA